MILPLGARDRDVGIKSRPPCSAGPYELLLQSLQCGHSYVSTFLPSTPASRVACDWDYFEAGCRRKNRRRIPIKYPRRAVMGIVIGNDWKGLCVVSTVSMVTKRKRTCCSYTSIGGLCACTYLPTSYATLCIIYIYI